MRQLIKKYKFLIFLIVLLFGIGLLYRQSAFFYVVVQGISMEPYFKDNQVVCFTKDIKNLNDGDIVVFHNHQENNIKRITASPGDFYYDTSSERSIYFENFSIEQSKTGMIYILHENQYFVEGDNKDGSIDSRIYGPINKEDILGKYVN